MEICEQYARDIISGKIPAGEPMLLAAQRFIREWESPAPWMKWDSERADFVIGLCETMTVYSALDGGRIPFKPLPWQQFLLRQWMGWRISNSELDPLGRENGTRRFRRIYLSTSKGAGKSPLAVPIMFLSLIEEPNAMCYCVALTDKQAQRPWQEFRDMAVWDAEMSNGKIEAAFRFRAGDGGQPAMIYCKLPGKHGKFWTVGSHVRATVQSGVIPNLVIAEEHHFHTSTRVMDMLADGTKLRKQPTTLLLANAPDVRYGPGFDEYTRAVQMLRGQQAMDDSYLQLIYELPEEDLEAATETKKKGDHFYYTEAAKRLWIKSNPSMPHTVRPDYIIGKLAAAKGEARKQEVYRLVFSIIPKRSDIDKLWIDWNQWQKCLLPVGEDPPAPELLKTCPVFLGIDLADNRAFSAVVAVFHLPDGRLHVRWHAFTPIDTLEERGKRAAIDFMDMAAAGEIETCSGGSIDYGIIVDVLEDYANTNFYNLRGIAFDQRFLSYITHELNERGIPWREANVRRKSRSRVDSAITINGSRMRSELKRGGMVFFRHPQGGLRSGDPNDLSMGRAMSAFEDRYAADPPGIQIERNRLADFMVMCATEHWSGAGDGSRRYISADRAAKTAGRAYNDLLVAMAMAVDLADWKQTELLAADGSKTPYELMADQFDAIQWGW